jgi:hypothetical protein
VTSLTRRISVRVVVAAVIIAIHVLLVVAFVPFVRVELPAFVVTEVSLALPESAEARPPAGSRDAPSRGADED